MAFGDAPGRMVVRTEGAWSGGGMRLGGNPAGSPAIWLILGKVIYPYVKKMSSIFRPFGGKIKKS